MNRSSTMRGLHRWLTRVTTMVGVLALVLLSVPLIDASQVAAAASTAPPCPSGSTDVLDSYGNATGICQVTFDGSTTWTVPPGVFSVDVVAVGGGGAGGARSGGAAGGGGGGAVENPTGQAVNPGDSETVTVGAGGSGSANSEGYAGESSSIGPVGSSGSSVVVAPGGEGGWDGTGTAVSYTAGDGGTSGDGESGGQAAWNNSNDTKTIAGGGGGGDS